MQDIRTRESQSLIFVVVALSMILFAAGILLSRF